MKFVKTILAVAVIASAGQVANAQQQTQRDKLRTMVQQICPVTGNQLGTHGTPFKVQVGKEKLFLCCKGCLQGKINPQHWATIHANFAKAQGICPVMKHKLPQNPKWTIVKGQIVYVCCPPCTKKISEQPEMYLQRIDELYAVSLQASQNSQ